MKFSSRIKKTIRSFLSLLVAFILIFQATVVPAFARISDTEKNSAEKNLTILQRLQSMYGDNLTEEDLIKELSEMGLLDEQGNINVSESVVVDGKTMTLTEIESMLNSEGVDLSKVVNINGINLTLGDLKKIIEIEYELARIKAKYFSNDVTLTPEHEKSLASLLNQVENSGISMITAGMENLINHNARLRVRNVLTGYVFKDSQEIMMEFSIVDGNSSVITLDYDVTFDWRLLDGTALKGVHYRAKSGEIPEGTITIPKGTSTVTIPLEIYQKDNNIQLHRWLGVKCFSIQLSNPVNILFEGGARRYDFPVSLIDTDVLLTRLETEAITADIDVNESGPYFTFPINDEDYKKLEQAAIEIFGSVANTPFYAHSEGKLFSFNETQYTMTAQAEFFDGNNNHICYDEPKEYRVYEKSDSNVDPAVSWGQAYITGVIPKAFRFSNGSFNPSPYPENKMTYKDRQILIEIVDNVKPNVVKITAPPGQYYSGQAIPITVEFSEPVKHSDLELYIQGESTPISAVNLIDGNKIKYATFLYTVPKSPASSLVISSVKNMVGIIFTHDPNHYGVNINVTDSWPSDGHLTTIEGVTMSMDPLLAIKNVSLANAPVSGTYAPNDIIQVRVDIDKDISQWLENDYDTDKNHLKSVYVKADGLTYPLVMGGTGTEEGSYYTALIPANKYASSTTTNLTIELYTDGTYVPEVNGDHAYFTDGTPIMGKYALASIGEFITVQSITLDTDSYPTNSKIFLTGTETIQLKASVSPDDASYKSIKWQSSDATIASIDESTGIVTPVRPGKVTFKAISYNGGIDDPIFAETPEFTVIDGGPPTILFPKGNNAFVTKKNEVVNIVWSQNLIGRTEGVKAEFKVDIFDGTNEVYSTTVIDTNKLTVPENILSKVSNGSEPAYIVEVTTVNPDNPTENLSAQGYIIVYPKPAKVTLDKLESYYITDAKTSLNIGWNLSEFSGGEFEFKIVKNKDTLYTSTTSSGSYFLPIDTVGDGFLKDIYVVSVKAKNTQDSSWSTDSFVLNVYSEKAMKIMVDGRDVDSLTMDNNAKIKEIYDESGSNGILSLRRNINLKSDISINYEEFLWASITDQIKWESQKSDVASVNYRQGNLYENIEKFSYSTYRPSTEFMLAGNSEGKTKIIATHAATGMVDTLDVDVKTLKNKLYLFSFYPKAETEITYINGKGESRTLYSNLNGEIAIYEESGIVSNISLKSGSGGNLYLGTLYKENLDSGEKDPGIYELYPINIFKLRPAAKIELFFKNKDGNPFTGQVTYRGAVYKNGQICPETMNKDGQVISIDSTGKFSLNFDATKFWVVNNTEQLQASDKLEFIYEVVTSDGEYYPQLLNVNGSISMEDVLKFGESVVNLRPVSDSDKNKAFIASQSINYNLKDGRTIDVTNYQGTIGPGTIYKTAELETLVAWWGSSKIDGYDVKVEDEFGALIEGQRVKTILYPFATMSYTKNITTLSEESLNLELGETKGGQVSLFDSSGVLLKSILCPFTFTNMVGAPEAVDGLIQATKDIKELGDKGFSFKDGMSGGNMIISLALKALSDSNVGLGGSTFYTTLSATEDPMVYRGVITAKMQMNSTDTEDVSVEIGGADTNFEYKYNPDSMADIIQEVGGMILDPPSPISAGIDAGVKLAGYFEVEVKYDTTAQEWVMVVMGGGFDLDALFGASATLNGVVGPVPVTASFNIGAATNLKFRAVKPYGNVPSEINAADVNDFYTALRLKAYISAFGGLGFDLSLVALKIGVFGKANLDYSAEFVNMPYMIEGDGLYAYLTTLGISGQVGVKFVAKYLFVTYETVLASVEGGSDFWVEGEEWRERLEDWKAKQTSSLMNSAKSMSTDLMSANLMESMTSLKTVKENTGYESRSYLDMYDRSWGESFLKRTLQAPSGVSNILTNAYPYANPVVTRDGEIMAYMSDSDSSDLNKTRASWMIKNSGEYINQGALPTVSEDEYADSNIQIDGTKNFAAAVWEQQGMEINYSQAPAPEDISAMMNSSEIVASIYDGTKWSTTLLTDNLVSDVAPVVAANNGKAVVAWRCMSGSDAATLLNSDLHDSIMYKIYENGSWSEARTLYNGAAGGIKGLSAAMMQDGTTGIVYTLDYGTDTGNAVFGYETLCTVIGVDNSIKADIRLTNNNSMDQNPQITVASFGAEGYKFVMGWHNATSEGTTDIKLAAVDKDGKVDNKFIESISSVYDNSQAIITSKFRFAKKEDAGIDDLAILWVQPNISYDKDTNNTAQDDCLKAIKFIDDKNGGIYLTTALDVAKMDEHTLIDHFDAYSDAENNVTAVILASSYTGELQNQGMGVYTVEPISAMKVAQAEFKNDISLKDTYFNYDDVKSGFKLPITFTVTNMGINPVSSVKVSLTPDNVIKTFESLNLLPNQSMVLTVEYDVPESGIHDLDYEVNSNFTNGDSVVKNGSLNIDVPDTGVSKVELIADDQGKRVIQAVLYNSSDVKLAGSGRKVYAGFYTSSTFEDASKVEVQEITGDELSLLDNGALNMRFTYTIPAQGIPQGGTRLYGRVWAEENRNGTWTEITEYNLHDNIRSILLQNPIEANNGKQFLIKVEQENNGVTKARVTIKNLSMSPSSNGNVIVKLLDEAGAVIETKFIAATAAELIALNGEESITKEVVFTKLGRRVVAEYFTADPNALTREIAGITLKGIQMDFNKTTKNYYLTANNLNNTLITAVAKNSQDIVEIRSSDGGTLLASGTGAALYSWNLPEGRTAKVQVKVSENSSDIYNINVTSLQERSGTVVIDVPERNYGKAIVNVSAIGLSNFVPLKWQYEKNGTWSDKMDWDEVKSNSFEILGEGTYTVAVRLIDANEYYIDSNTMVILVQKPGSNTSYEDEGNYHVNVSGSNLLITRKANVAQVDVGAISKDIFNTGNSIDITMPKIPGINSYVLGIPADYLSGASKRGTLNFITSIGKMTLPTDMLDNIPDSQGKEAEIAFGYGDKSDLSDSMKAAIGDRPLIQLLLTLNGEQVEWNNPNAPVTVTIPYTPTEEELKNPESIVVWYIDGSGKAVSVPNGHYDSVSGTVTFMTTHFSDYAVAYRPISFTDVAKDAWYKKAVNFIAARQITSGTGNGNYSPMARITRGEFITLLMRAYDIAPDNNPTDNFDDAGNTYFSGYLAAAKRLGISQGTGKNMFSPGKEITRQEMFTLLYNALKVIDRLPSALSNGKPTGNTGKTLGDFTDANEINSWAKEAFTLLVETGTVVGNNGKLTPNGTATRAEMAQILYSLLSK